MTYCLIELNALILACIFFIFFLASKYNLLCLFILKKAPILVTDFVAAYLILSSLINQRYCLITCWIDLAFRWSILFLILKAKSIMQYLKIMMLLLASFTLTRYLAFLNATFILLATCILYRRLYLVICSKLFTTAYFIIIFFAPSNIWLSYNYFLQNLSMILLVSSLKSYSVFP